MHELAVWAAEVKWFMEFAGAAMDPFHQYLKIQTNRFVICIRTEKKSLV